MAFEKHSLSGILLFAAPLYAAPVLAGASAASWAAVPVFAALFAALILRTRALPDAVGALVVNVVFALVLNSALALVLFALGRGIAAFTGPLPIPVWGALLIGAAATAFGIWRYRWTPERAQLEAALDDALAKLEEINQSDNSHDTHSDSQE